MGMWGHMVLLLEFLAPLTGVLVPVMFHCSTPNIFLCVFGKTLLLRLLVQHLIGGGVGWTGWHMARASCYRHAIAVQDGYTWYFVFEVKCQSSWAFLMIKFHPPPLPSFGSDNSWKFACLRCFNAIKYSIWPVCFTEPSIVTTCFKYHLYIHFTNGIQAPCITTVKSVRRKNVSHN